jgi:hypothetical protein
MAFNKTEAENRFENFLIIMDDQIESLKEESEKYGINLDDSLSDLDKLENLFDLMRLEKSDEEISSLIVFFARHLGEIVRLNYGGKWFIQLDDAHSVNFNEPVIIGHAPIENLDFAPISVMRSYALRGKKGTLRSAVEADIDPKAIDLDNLIED